MPKKLSTSKTIPAHERMKALERGLEAARRERKRLQDAIRVLEISESLGHRSEPVGQKRRSPVPVKADGHERRPRGKR